MWREPESVRPPVRGLCTFGIAEGLSAATIGTIASAAATAVGTGVSIAGAASSAAAQERQANYQKQVAEQQAETAHQAGIAAEADQRTRAARFMAEQRAAIGSGGIQTTGTPLSVLLDTSRQAELDVQRARAAGELQAHGYDIGADVAGQRARSAWNAFPYQAGQTLLTGAADLYRPYARRAALTTGGSYDPGNANLLY